MDDRQRERIRGSLEQYFEKNSAPRFYLSVIMAVTGGVGFVVSWVLLHFEGVDMWIRYPAAVMVAYFVFLGLLRVWAGMESRRVSPGTMERITAPILDGKPARSYQAKSHDSWFNFLDDINFRGEDMSDGCALVAILLAAAGSVLAVIATAPALIADVFLDAVLITMIYKHLKTAARHDWLGVAVSRTRASVIILCIAGALVQWNWPGAKTIGDIFHVPERGSR